MGALLAAHSSVGGGQRAARLKEQGELSAAEGELSAESSSIMEARLQEKENPRSRGLSSRYVLPTDSCLRNLNHAAAALSTCSPCLCLSTGIPRACGHVRGAGLPFLSALEATAGMESAWP